MKQIFILFIFLMVAALYLSASDDSEIQGSAVHVSNGRIWDGFFSSAGHEQVPKKVERHFRWLIKGMFPEAMAD